MPDDLITQILKRLKGSPQGRADFIQQLQNEKTMHDALSDAGFVPKIDVETGRTVATHTIDVDTVFKMVDLLSQQQKINVLRNGSFETGNLRPWIVTGGATIESTTVFSGKYSCKLTTGGVIAQFLPYPILGSLLNVNLRFRFTMAINDFIMNYWYSDGTVDTIVGDFDGSLANTWIHFKEKGYQPNPEKYVVGMRIYHNGIGSMFLDDIVAEVSASRVLAYLVGDLQYLAVDADGKIGVSSLPAITGSVTANAGTNLNTSALALEATLTAFSAKLTNPLPVSLSTLLNPHPVSLASIPNPSNLDVALSTRATGAILNPHPVSLSTLLNPHPVSLASIPNPSNLDVALSTRATGTILNPHPISGSLGRTWTLGATDVPDLSDRATRQIGSVSLGCATGKTNVLKTGQLVTTAITADQVILTYTVTAGKTFYLEYLRVDTRLTTFAVTTTYFGMTSLENPSGTKLITQMQAGAGITGMPPLVFAEPIPIGAGTVIRVVCTPSSTTSYTWQANFGGYEK